MRMEEREGNRRGGGYGEEKGNEMKTKKEGNVEGLEKKVRREKK